ncbi:serine O-acetyltransferase [Clostridium sp. MB05]|uniref:serine O-acetyltransferase n=1 Tax=Clostridium sp. MB05 TaxID=3376682 RepID=UPI00398293B1
MKKIIKDFKYYKNNSLSKSRVAVIINPCFLCMVLFRISNYMYKRKLKLLAKVIWFINRVTFNVDIDYRAEISEEVMLIHGLGIVIGHEVRIDRRVKIYQGVTLGGNNGKTDIYEGKEISQPVIEENCVIAPNSMIFGPVVIKKNSFVKAGKIISR